MKGVPVQQAGLPQRLAGKVAMVTGGGGTNSIGRSICLRFAAEGAKVGVVDLDFAKAASVAEEIRKMGGTALAVACDVSRLEDCEAAARALADSWGGHLDILVNNAATFRGPSGPYHPRPFDQWTTEQWDHMLDVNLRGMWSCARAVHPYMKAKGYGKIINVSSSTFWEGGPGLVPYVASKGGVIGLTRSLARALGPEGIRVNCIAPGYTLTATNLEQPGDGSFAAGIRAAQCLTERSELPDDLAGPAFYLASPDSDFMTGQTLLVDGGLNFN
jgi:NAD(P)-dependent dehydrogenase (short-subunit alcohol dehydrogenase family)